MPAIRQGIREVEHDILPEEPDQLGPIVFLEASESQPTSGNDLGIVHLVFLLPTSVLLGASSKADGARRLAFASSSGMEDDAYGAAGVWPGQSFSRSISQRPAGPGGAEVG